MNGVFGFPITVDWLWFSSMITKIRLTAAFAPLSGLLADAEPAGTTTAAARAAAASNRVSLGFVRMGLLSRGAWMSPAPGTLDPAPASLGSRPRHRGPTISRSVPAAGHLAPISTSRFRRRRTRPGRTRDRRRWSGCPADPARCPAWPRERVVTGLARSTEARSADVAERLARLAPGERAAATAPPGPVLCVAPAGSGKTTTLVARVAWLVDGGADPASICVVAFNKRAAEELTDRLDAALSPLGVTAGSVRVRTFHALWREILLDARVSVDPLIDRDARLRELFPE